MTESDILFKINIQIFETNYLKYIKVYQIKSRRFFVQRSKIQLTFDKYLNNI